MLSLILFSHLLYSSQIAETPIIPRIRLVNYYALILIFEDTHALALLYSTEEAEALPTSTVEHLIVILSGHRVFASRAVLHLTALVVPTLVAFSSLMVVLLAFHAVHMVANGTFKFRVPGLACRDFKDIWAVRSRATSEVILIILILFWSQIEQFLHIWLGQSLPTALVWAFNQRDILGNLLLFHEENNAFLVENMFAVVERFNFFLLHSEVRSKTDLARFRIYGLALDGLDLFQFFVDGVQFFLELFGQFFILLRLTYLFFFLSGGNVFHY